MCFLHPVGVRALAQVWLIADQMTVAGSHKALRQIPRAGMPQNDPVQ